MTHGSLPLPSEMVGEAGVGQVSWLEAALLAFPGVVTPSGMESKRSETLLGPLTVAGPRRIHTGFRVDPPADSVVKEG